MCFEVLQKGNFPFMLNSFFANKSIFFQINQLKQDKLFEKIVRNKYPVKTLKTCRYCTPGTPSKFEFGQLSPFSMKIARIRTAYIT